MDEIYLGFLKEQKNPSGFHAPLHNHSCYELVYYISGEGTFFIENEEYTYGPGTFSIIPPKFFHEEYVRKFSKLLYIGFYCINYDHILLPGLYHDSSDFFVLQSLQAMQAEFQQKKPMYSSMLNVQVQGLIIKLIRTYFQPKSQNQDERMEYIRRYIHQHCIENLSLDELSEMAGYSYDWFRHLFKQHTGYSPAQYIKIQKLELAARQLRTTDKNVTQIGFELNFPSSSQFILLFKKKYHMSPLQYRKNFSDLSSVNYSNK